MSNDEVTQTPEAGREEMSRLAERFDDITEKLSDTIGRCADTADRVEREAENLGRRIPPDVSSGLGEDHQRLTSELDDLEAHRPAIEAFKERGVIPAADAVEAIEDAVESAEGTLEEAGADYPEDEGEDDEDDEDEDDED